jgi:acyl carrier protein
LVDTEIKMSEFYEGLAEILELEPGDVGPDLALKDVSWDSLAIVSTIALVDDVFGVALNANRLAECETVADIEKLAREEQD